jgi:alpha-tubulin suppressor-like RCC1 family protein
MSVCCICLRPLHKFLNASIETNIPSHTQMPVLSGKHSAAITDDGKLYTWGEGFCGQLGHGTAESKPEPTLVEGLSTVQVVVT